MSLLRLPRCQACGGCPGEGDKGQNKGKEQKTANLVGSATNDASPTSGNAAAPTPAMMDMVYETFSAAPNGPGDAGAPQRRVVVLWIDDSLFGRHWLSRVVILLKDLNLSGEGVRLRILGPADTGGPGDAGPRGLPGLLQEARQPGARKSEA